MRPSRASKPIAPILFDGESLSGLFPQDINELSMANIGQAVTVVMKADEVILGHDGSEQGLELLRHLGVGLTLQGTNVVIHGLCTADELRFKLLQGRVKHGVYLCEDLRRPGTYEIHCLNGNGETNRDAADLIPIAKLAQRAAFLPTIRAGRKNERLDDSTGSYCDAIVAASLVGAGSSVGAIVSNAPNAAIDHLLSHLEKAAKRADVAVDIVIVPRRSFRRQPNPLDRREAIEAVRDAVVAQGAAMGLVWHSATQAPDIIDETGALVSHRDVMLLIAQSLLAERHGRTVVHDRRCSWATAALPRHPLSQTLAAAPDQPALSDVMRQGRATYGFMLPGIHLFSDLHFAESGLAAALFVASLSAPGTPLSQRVAATCGETGCAMATAPVAADVGTVLSEFGRIIARDGIQTLHKSMLLVETTAWNMAAHADTSRNRIEISIETRAGRADDVLQTMLESLSDIDRHCSSADQ